jgi:hypothetical protein
MRRRSNNVLPFPSDNPSGVQLKLFALVFYLFLAYLLTFGLGLSEDGLFALMILGVIYNIFVRNRLHSGSYFQEHKVILVILLVIFLLVFKLAMVLLLLLAGAYWLLVGKSGREAPYFLRFHLLTALILDFFILMPYLLLSAVFMLLGQLFKMGGLGVLVAPGMLIVEQGLPLFFMGLFWGAAAWLSISAVMGRTPYIPVVTGNVRHWAS